MKSYVLTEPELAKELLEEKIFFIPTDTVYGLAGIFTENVLEKIKQAKHREASKAIPVAVSTLEMAQEIAVLDQRAQKLIKAFLPGPLTLVVPKKDTVDSKLTNGKETIALRIPDQPELLSLIDRINRPLFLTSANLSGQKEAKNLDQVRKLQIRADGLVEGICAGQQASTIADLSGPDFRILRSGPIGKEDLLQKLIDD